jgi:hypothetical protein
MAGPSKRRARAEKKQPSSSGDSSGASHDPTEQSTPKSIPRLDGNRDPVASRIPVDYSKATDLKNISEALGLGGWYAARGVSTNTFLLFRSYAAPYSLVIQTLCNLLWFCPSAVPIPRLRLRLEYMKSSSRP